MNTLRFLGFSSLVFALTRIPILSYAILDYQNFSSLLYHPSNELNWWLVYFIIPVALSLGLGYVLQSKLKRLALLKYFAMVHFTLLIAGGIIIGIKCNNYWGYALKRPSIFSEVQHANQLYRTTFISSSKSGDSIKIELDTFLLPQSDLTPTRHYYNNSMRAFLTFNQQEKLYGRIPHWLEIVNDTSNVHTQTTLDSIVRMVYETGIIENGSPHYDSIYSLRGHLIEFKTDHHTYMYTNLHGREVANDHYPFYEFLFEKHEKKWKLLKTHKYFTDFAGREGFEYSFLEPLLSVLLLPSILVLYSLTSLVVVVYNRRRMRTM